MTLRTEVLPDTRPRFRGLRALLAGPLLLAGLTLGPRTLVVADADDPAKWLTPVPSAAYRQLRSLTSVLPSGGRGGYVSADGRGLSLIAGAPPTRGAHDAPAATHGTRSPLEQEAWPCVLIAAFAASCRSL